MKNGQPTLGNPNCHLESVDKSLDIDNKVPLNPGRKIAV